MNVKQRWYQKDNSAAVFYMLSAAVWLVLGVTMGLFLALEFVFPDLFAGIPYLVFGRLRQAHTKIELAQELRADHMVQSM